MADSQPTARDYEGRCRDTPAFTFRRRFDIAFAELIRFQLYFSQLSLSLAEMSFIRIAARYYADSFQMILLYCRLFSLRFLSLACHIRFLLSITPPFLSLPPLTLISFIAFSPAG
jgi:hypothetical protein